MYSVTVANNVTDEWNEKRMRESIPVPTGLLRREKIPREPFSGVLPVHGSLWQKDAPALDVTC